jgi:hypothetical protein
LARRRLFRELLLLLLQLLPACRRCNAACSCCQLSIIEALLTCAPGNENRSRDHRGHEVVDITLPCRSSKTEEWHLMSRRDLTSKQQVRHGTLTSRLATCFFRARHVQRSPRGTSADPGPPMISGILQTVPGSTGPPCLASW